MFHLEKLKDLTGAQEYAVTVSYRFGVFDTLEDPEELWDTFKRETLEAAKECNGNGAPGDTEWLHLGRDAEKVLRRAALPDLLGTMTSTGLCHVGLELF